MNSRRTLLGAAVAAPLLYPLARRVIVPDGAAPFGDDGGALPNVPLETHDGLAVRFYDDLVRNRLVVVNMMYANCTNICPPNTASLLQVQQALGERVGRDVFMYSLTLQPAIDRPEDLRRYMRKYGVGQGWTFLTGRPAAVDLLRRRLGFYNFDAVADADLKQHTGMVRIGHDGRDRWSMVPAMATTRQIVDSIAAYL
ncbi:SCO family protein [Telluria sp. B2]